MMDKRNKKQILFFVVNSIIIFGLILLANRNLKIHSKPLISDSQQSTFLAYHLVIDGFHSMDGLTPSNFREPVISFLNALNIARLEPEKNQITKYQLINDPELILEMTKLNLIYLFVIYWLVYYLSRKLGIPRILSIIASIIPVFFFSVYTSYITSVNSELPSAILLMIFSIFILNYFDEKKSKYLISSGLILGLLALTKAVFLYLFILLVPSIILFDGLISKKKLFLKPSVFVLFLISFCIPVGSWMIRNSILLGTSSISDRGGEVLLIRAIKNQMTDEEYWGGYYAYAPEVIQTLFFEKYLEYKKEDLSDGGILQRLNRSLKGDSLAMAEGRYKDVHSYLRIAQLEHRNLTNFYGNSLEVENLDKGSKSKARNLILSHPWNHLKTSFLFGWRGVWFYKGRHLIPVLMTFLMYLSLFILFVKSFWTRGNTLFLITILPILYFLFHSFFTHFIPRYSGLLIPLCSVYFILVINIFLNKFQITNSRNDF